MISVPSSPDATSKKPKHTTSRREEKNKMHRNVVYHDVTNATGDETREREPK